MGHASMYWTINTAITFNLISVAHILNKNEIYGISQADVKYFYNECIITTKSRHASIYYFGNKTLEYERLLHLKDQ